MPTPLFNPNYEAMKASLRLSDASRADTNTAIAEELVRVRTMIYARLGESIIDDILLTPLTDTPSTALQIRRANANLLESTWLRLRLLRRLPVLFQDASGQAQQTWNEEGTSRRAGQSDLDKELGRLDSDVEGLILAILGGNTDEGGSVQGGAIGPTVANAPIGSSVFSYPGYWCGTRQ